MIVDEATSGETDELVLAGGIEPREVSFYRPAQSPDDLGLALAKRGSILIEGFLASPSAGIERVVFDRNPAWSREDLERFAREAPLLDDDAAGASGPLADLGDVVTALDPRAVRMPPGDPLQDIALDTVF